MKKQTRNPWSWIPSLYFAEGIPYVAVMIVSVIMYKRLGISNTDIALYTSWLYLPWVIKPFWSPFVDSIKTKRSWIIIMQLLIGAGLAGVALTIPAPDFFRYTLAFFWLLAFSSATHDIAADGFYMLGLSTHDQAWFVGIRSTFYRLAMITGQGLLVIFAGSIESSTGLDSYPITVNTAEDASYHMLASTDSLQFEPAADGAGFVAWPSTITMPVGPDAGSSFAAVLEEARNHNARHGFLVDEDQVDMEDEKTSLWSRTVGRAFGTLISDPLESFLRKYFGEDRDTEGLSPGSYGIAYMRLAEAVPDGEEYIVNIERDSGSKNLDIVQGERLVVNGSNWNIPAILIFQVDPRLQDSASATFLATSGNVRLAWTLTFFLLTAFFILAAIYHRFILPYPAEDGPKQKDNLMASFGETFVSFFRKDRIGIAILFLLFYRFGEAQLVKLAAPFLLDTPGAGGLSLSTGQVGFVYGTVGIVALTVGGLLGGFVAARHGLKKWLWPMVIAINVPNAVYLFLATTVPDNFVLINICVAIEQFGYGFGFTAYMLYMIYIAEGEHKTAHFAICTGFMALGMMIPGMFSGWIEDIIGYQNFFGWVLIATIPGFIVSALIPLDPEFGKKEDSNDDS